MKQAKLTVRARDSFGSPESRRMRRESQIPGVLYGGGQSSTPLSVDEKELRQALGHERSSMILNLVFEGTDKSQLAMIKEHQSDPVTGSLVHLDFIEVRMDQPLESTTHVELVGQAAGLRDGGIMDHALRELHIRSLPKDMPTGIECNVESLGIGDSIRVSDLVAPEGVEILNDPETMVAAVMAPKLVVEEEVEGVEGEEGELAAEAAEETPAAEGGEEA
ncbi:MAG: 50S ribosomal protein L25 [Thermoleophilia bacterium]